MDFLSVLAILVEELEAIVNVHRAETTLANRTFDLENTLFFAK